MADAIEYTVKLEKLVYGGEAMGRLPDGRAVFVPFALPGEKVRTRLVVDKRGYARGELLAILEPSSIRIEPRCQHYSICGGCHYQHLSYTDQLTTKTEILKDQLVRLGGFDDPLINPIIPSPSEWNYRNQIHFHQDPTGSLGFPAMGSKNIMKVEECFLPQDALNEFWPSLELGGLNNLTGIKLNVGDDEKLMLVLESSSDEAFEIEVDFPIKIVQVGPEAVHVMADTYYQETEILGRPFRYSVGTFFRANIPVVEKMVEYLLETLPLNSDGTLLEIYSGVGVFSAFLAPKVGRLVGIEANSGAVRDFAVNLEDFENAEIYEDLAEVILPKVDFEIEVILVDPPRAGLGTKILDEIVTISPKVLAYVSSDPATLARDGKRLTKVGYSLKNITPFDLLPQTYHVDSISIWEKG